MSESVVIWEVFKRHWKILVKWILRIHDYPEITVDELYERFTSENPPVLIDIREEGDYNGTGYSKYGHIPNALSIPILDLEIMLKELVQFKDKEVVTMCPGGGLSLAAVDILREAGFKDAKSLKGGTDLWHKKEYPTTTT